MIIDPRVGKGYDPPKPIPNGAGVTLIIVFDYCTLIHTRRYALATSANK